MNIHPPPCHTVTGVLEGFSPVVLVAQHPAGSYNIGAVSQPKFNFDHPYRSLKQSGGSVEAARPPRTTLRLPLPGPAEASQELLFMTLSLLFSIVIDIDFIVHFSTISTSSGPQKP